MRTKTSFFNKKIFFKNLYQALPIILIMTGFLTVILITSATNTLQSHTDHSPTDFINRMLHYNLYDYTSTVFLKFLLVVYSFFCGVFVFRYLYPKKICTTLHALPLTRTCLYLSNVLSGFVMLIVPAILSAAIYAVFMIINGYAVSFLPLWLLIVAAFCSIFYALSVFAAMLTGQLLATPIIYFFLNFGIIITQYLMTTFVNNFFFGVEGEPSKRFLILTPFIYLENHLHLIDGQQVAYSDKAIYALIIYAIASLVILVISWFLYRARNLENQGNPIATKRLQPLFLYAGTLLAGTTFSLLLYKTITFHRIGNSASKIELMFLIALFLLCSVISYFVIVMLLHKTIRVFKNNYKGILAYCGISCLLFLLIMLDVFHIVQRIPEIADIERVYFCFETLPVKIEGNEKAVKEIITIHQSVLDEQEALTNTDFLEKRALSWLDITYKKKNGTLLSRRYLIPISNLDESGTPIGRRYQTADACLRLLQDKELMQSILDEAYSSISDIYIYNNLSNDGEPISVTNHKKIYEALKKDLSNNTLIWDDLVYTNSEQSANTHGEILYTIELVPNFDIVRDANEDYIHLYQYNSCRYAITSDCTNTIELIKQLGIE